MRVRNIASLMLAASFVITGAVSAQYAPEPDITITAQERGAAIEGSIRQLNANYVFPDVAKKMEEAVRARAARGEYDRITSARDLAEKLTSDFRAVSSDKHLRVTHSSKPAAQNAAAPSPHSLLSQRDYLSRINYGFEKVERLQGNIGYLDLRLFVDPNVAGETAAAAMTFLANTDALIVDLRKNGGGEPAMIAFLSTYLFDNPTHLNDIYDRTSDSTQQYWTLGFVPGRRFGGSKPVYVLTSSFTFSGGEEFTYNLKNLKRATIIGETTGGGAHPVQPFRASDHFTIGVPFARAINPITKTNWEGTGVSPDIALPADQALDKAIALALDEIIRGTQDPARKGALERLRSSRS